MLRTLLEWKVFAFEKGISRDMVFDILRDWQEDRNCLLANQSSRREKMENELAVCDECLKQFWFSRGIIVYSGLPLTPKLLCPACYHNLTN